MFKLYGTTKNHATFEQSFDNYQEMMLKLEWLKESGFQVWYDFDLSRVIS